jgi:hypothetical protein
MVDVSMVDVSSCNLSKKSDILPFEHLGPFSNLVQRMCFVFSPNFINKTLEKIDLMYSKPCFDSFLSTYYIKSK